MEGRKRRDEEDEATKEGNRCKKRGNKELHCTEAA
jgi:hypothetical protein